MSVESQLRARSPPRTRPSSSQHRATASRRESIGESMYLHSHTHLGVSHKLDEKRADQINDKTETNGIFINPSNKQVQKMISPFLSKHIPQQYNPQGLLTQDTSHEHDNELEQNHAPSATMETTSGNTKYCYRHRPDMKCRRQPDEPTMDQLQKELSQLPQSDQEGIAHTWSMFSAAPAKLRNLMLQGILQQCCFPQLSFISAAVRDLIKIDFISALPPELAFKILCYLDTASLCKAAQVCRRWRTLADDDVIWHRMCEQHIDRKCTKCGWGLPLMEKERLRLEKRQIQLRATGRGINEWSPTITPSLASSGDVPSTSLLEADSSMPDYSYTSDGTTSHIPALKRSFDHNDELTNLSPTKRPCLTSADSANHDSHRDVRRRRPWKDVYKDRFKVGTNWKYGRYSEKVFRGHTNGVMCLQLRDNVLATGSYDCTAKIWDVDTGALKQTLQGHTAGIRALFMDENLLFTGGIDQIIKVWNWRDGKHIRNIPGHSGTVLSLHYCNTLKYLASGSADHTIRVLDMSSKRKFRLEGHTDWVNAVRIDSRSRTLFSASDDTTVKLWDLDTQQLIRTFEGHVGQVQQVIPLPHEFELDDEMETEFHRYSDNDHSDYDSEDSSRSPPPRYMLTGSLDATIQLWHVPTGRSIRKFFGHIEGIWGLAADTLRIVSGGEDRVVKIWDPRTGQCERTFAGKYEAPVTCVGLSDCRLASGSEDATIRVYSFEHHEPSPSASAPLEHQTSSHSGSGM